MHSNKRFTNTMNRTKHRTTEKELSCLDNKTIILCAYHFHWVEWHENAIRHLAVSRELMVVEDK